MIAISYYIADCLYVLSHYDVFEENCMMGMIIHHVATIHGATSAVQITYYPWFLTLPWALHCILIMFPYNKLFHVPYVASLLFMLYKLFTRPFSKTHFYRGIAACTPMLTVGLLYISLNGCDTNDLKY